jgi:transposase-like protein
MKTTSIIRDFGKLSYQEQRQLLDQLKLTVSESKPILTHRKIRRECIDPNCKSVRIYKHGKSVEGGQRYRCQDCKKCFNELTGTSIHCVKKKHLWDRFIELMFESKSVRYISKELGISPTTVFEWRHKILTSFDGLYQKGFKKVVETDDVYFPINQKGRKKNFIPREKRKQGTSDQKVSVLFTMDRFKTYGVKMVKVGKMDIKNLDRVLERGRLNKDNIICSDSDKSLLKLIGELGLDHKTFKTGLKQYTSGKGYHVNNLNNLVGRLKEWMRYNFHTVSTKYLINYLNWFVMMEILKGRDSKMDKFWDYTLMDNGTFGRSKRVEEEYQEFLKY